jgi:transposase-like protein
MTQRKSAYPPAFRAEAIQLTRTSGKPQTTIARELGMSVETLWLWLKQADLDAGNRSDGVRVWSRRSYAVCAARIAVCAKSARSSKKRQPSSPRRPTRPGERLRVRGAREAREGQPCCRPALPRAGRLPQWLLGVAEPAQTPAAAENSCASNGWGICSCRSNLHFHTGP